MLYSTRVVGGTAYPVALEWFRFTNSRGNKLVRLLLDRVSLNLIYSMHFHLYGVYKHARALAILSVQCTIRTGTFHTASPVHPCIHSWAYSYTSKTPMQTHTNKRRRKINRASTVGGWVVIKEVPGWKKPSANLPRLDTSLCTPESGRPTATVSAARDGAPRRSRKLRSRRTEREDGPRRVSIAPSARQERRTGAEWQGGSQPSQLGGF